MSRSPLFQRIVSIVVVVASAACSSVLGLGDFSIESNTADGGVGGARGTPLKPTCTTNRECTERAATAVDGGVGPLNPSVCLHPQGQCVALLSEDCSVITGDYTDDRAIVIGSLFSTSGAQASTNLARQQSATLAVEEINAAGGIPSSATSADAQPLVMVSCDESVNLMRAGHHLVEELHVPAIVGPNTSQDTLDLSNKLTIAAGTLLMSPTAVASSIADLLDNGLTWQIIPTDVQRAPLMIQEINALETQLRAQRKRDVIKLSVIYRDDALGQGTRVSLNALQLNGKPLADPVNLGSNVRIDPYDFKQPNQQAIVDATVKLAPDIVVLAGPAESITSIMVPIEAAWQGPADSRPEYVLIDSAKVPELLSAVSGNDDLRHRVRGTGVTPGMRSIPVNETFMVSYATRYPGAPTNIFGMGPAYDSTYAIAYAIAGLHGMTLTGPHIAQGLRRLAGGSSVLEVQSTKILAAFRKLAAGEPVTVIGTFTALQWSDNGAIMGGTIELWCVSNPNGKPTFEQSGLMFDTQSGQAFGHYTQCD